jgi:hypothetical protein
VKGIRMAAVALLNQALAALHLENQAAAEIYTHVNEIVAHLQGIHAQNPINIVVTGNISERLCDYGLRAAVAGPRGGTYARMPRHWKWIGDFYLAGEPFNTVISVKSFKAKERLLASGSGNLLSPTIGWGLFNDPTEFSYDRVVSYAYRSFMAIYAPTLLIEALPAEVRNFANINRNPFMRDLSALVADLQAAMSLNGRLNPRLI